jgi:hypothetical protein
LLLAEKTAEVDRTDAGLQLLKTAMQCDCATDFRGQRRGQVDGLEFAVDEDRQGQLRMKVFGLARGTAAVGFAAAPAALDKTAREHVA